MAEDTPPTAKRPAEENEVIPWSVVFAFASGIDAAHAMATTKSTSRGTLFSDDDVTAGLNLRLLEKSKVGKRILSQLSSPPEGRFWLPKFMHCVDNNLYLRSDGLYHLPASAWLDDHYLRFYKDNTVSFNIVNKEPGKAWVYQMRKSRRRAEPVRYDWIKLGHGFIKVRFTVGKGNNARDYNGELRSDGSLRLNVYKHRNDRRSEQTFNFVRAHWSWDPGTFFSECSDPESV